jgi:hypothetical protein
MAQAPATIQLCAAADLAPTSLSLSPTKVKGGDSVTFQAEVANLGGTPAANVAVRFLLDGAQLGTERTIASLAGGASVAVSSEAWTAKHEDGSHRVTVLVDPANAVAESNEANNTRDATFLVEGNKIANGSFEQSSNGSSPDAWTASGETGYTGGSGARSVWAAPGGSWTSDPVAVEAGRGYEASVLAFGAGGTLVVQQLGADGRVLASTAQPLLPMMALVLTKLPVTALEGATKVRVVLLGGLAGTTTFDDVRLVDS